MLEAALGIDTDLWLMLRSDCNRQIAKSDGLLFARLERIRQFAAFL